MFLSSGEGVDADPGVARVVGEDQTLVEGLQVNGWDTLSLFFTRDGTFPDHGRQGSASDLITYNTLTPWDFEENLPNGEKLLGNP